MSNVRIQDRDYLFVKRRVNGWDLTVCSGSWDTAHVIAMKGVKDKRSWNVSQMLNLRRGRWVIGTMKDKWAIRYKSRYPGDQPSNWDKQYSPPGARRIINHVRLMAARILNTKKAARWRFEGLNRRKEAAQALANYFEKCKALDEAQKRKSRAKAIYTTALKREKAYTPKRPR